MMLRSLWVACLIISALCLLVTFGLYSAGLGPVRWAAAGAVLALTFGLFAQPRLSAAWLPLASLAGLTVIGGVGLVLGAPLYLVAPGIAAALAASDIAPSLTRLGGAPSASARRYERTHIMSLGLALGPGLLLVVAGSIISLDIPFLPLILLVILALLSFEQALKNLSVG